MFMARTPNPQANHQYGVRPRQVHGNPRNPLYVIAGLIHAPTSAVVLTSRDAWGFWFTPNPGCVTLLVLVPRLHLIITGLIVVSVGLLRKWTNARNVCLVSCESMHQADHQQKAGGHQAA